MAAPRRRKDFVLCSFSLRIVCSLLLEELDTGWACRVAPILTRRPCFEAGACVSAKEEEGASRRLKDFVLCSFSRSHCSLSLSFALFARSSIKLLRVGLGVLRQS